MRLPRKVPPKAVGLRLPRIVQRRSESEVPRAEFQEGAKEEVIGRGSQVIVEGRSQG